MTRHSDTSLNRTQTTERGPNWPSMETTDAMEWVNAWMLNFPYPVNASLDDIKGTMLAWFANAIETGRSAGREEIYDQVDGVG